MWFRGLDGCSRYNRRETEQKQQKDQFSHICHDCTPSPLVYSDDCRQPLRSPQKGTALPATTLRHV
jgi:hypothetical protein